MTEPRSNAEWRYWGATDPLWAAARFDGKSANSPHAWTADEFRELGKHDFSDVWRHWRHYGVVPDRCVEIGCGAGRMTGPLAEHFASVLALDVSPHQIAKARDLLGHAVQTITFELVRTPTIPVSDGTCSAMFSCHVFQHLPGWGHVGAYLRESYRVVRSGGTICFHLPTSGAHLASPQSDWWYRVRNGYKRVRRRLGTRAIAEYHRYPAAEVLRRLLGLGFVGAELRVFAMTSNGDHHSYFFATRP